MVGNLFNFVMTLSPTVATPQAPVKRKRKPAFTTVSKNRDIREMFVAPKKKKTSNVIVVDDDQSKNKSLTPLYAEFFQNFFFYGEKAFAF